MPSHCELWDHILLIYKVAVYKCTPKVYLLGSILEKLWQIFKHAVSGLMDVDDMQMKFIFMLITLSFSWLLLRIFFQILHPIWRNLKLKQQLLNLILVTIQMVNH